MKTAATAAALLVSVAAASEAAADSNPLGTVLALMADLTAKITKEGEEEAAAFKEYFEWCDDVSKNKNFEIKTATAEMEKLQATIMELTAKIGAENTKIEGLAADIASSTEDLKSATAIRDKEAEDFASSEAELVEAVDMMGRALTVLQREMKKNPAALAQVSTNDVSSVMQSLSAVVDAAAFSSSDKKSLLALVQSHQESEDDDMVIGAPEAAVYKTHSSSILDVIADMEEKAQVQLSDLRKAEKTAQHNYELLKQSLEDEIANDNKDMDAAKSSKAAAEEEKGVAEGDLAVTQSDLKAAQEALAKANASCMQVANDHDATIRARSAELKVLAEATKILESSTGGAVAQTYSFIQVSARSRAELARSEVIVLVKRLAKQHHSAALAQLASRIQAVERYQVGDDAFGKVKGLIQDMLKKLEAEAASEATEKAFCDEEMGKTEMKKGELDEDIAKVSQKLDRAAAKSAELKQEVKDLQEELATMAAEQAEATKVRQDAHAVFVKAKAELEAGLIGVRKALDMLREYYALNADAGLLQQPEPPMPKAHTAAGGAGGSIIGVLEVCEADFAENLAKEETAESDAAEAYEKMTQENKVSTAAKTQDVTYKTREYTSLDKSMAGLAADRETLNEELAAVTEYYEKLKERCIAKPETYEERKKRRESEIAGLKEALTILENETAFTQRSSKGRHMRGSLSAGALL